MPGSGVLAFNAARRRRWEGEGWQGGACAAWPRAADRPAAASAQEPVGIRESPGTGAGALSGAVDRSPRPAGAAARPGPGSGGQDVRAGEYRPPARTRCRPHGPGPRPRAARCRPDARGLPGCRLPPLGLLGPGYGAAWGRLPQAGLSVPAFLSIFSLESRVGGARAPPRESPRTAGLAEVFVGPQETPETAGTGRSPCYPPGTLLPHQDAIPSGAHREPHSRTAEMSPRDRCPVGLQGPHRVARPGPGSVPLPRHTSPRTAWPGGALWQPPEQLMHSLSQEVFLCS